MPSKSEILRGARAVIADPARWCQGHLAVDKNGNYALYTAPEAVRWCMAGAVGVAAKGAIDSHNRALEYMVGDMLHGLAQSKGESSMGNFNDNHTHAEVLTLMDEAIHLAETEEAMLALPLPLPKYDFVIV